MTTTEFTIIEKYFNREKPKRSEVLLGIGDDAALLQIPSDQSLAVCVDTLVAGVHFPTHTPPTDIGYKALAVNLSDLAATGADPVGFTLALTVPSIEQVWIEQFCTGLFHLADQHNVQLMGGDLTKGPLTITIQAHGFVPASKALKRSGAKPGDLIYVTGTLGDAGLALRLLKAKKRVPATILQRLNRPTPRVAEGIALRGLANSVIDISDGLIADLDHILEASHVGAKLLVDTIPLSTEFKQFAAGENALEIALTAGDDYELCFTVPPHLKAQLETQLSNITCIGIIEEAPGIKLQHDDGKIFQLQKTGYRHF